MAGKKKPSPAKLFPPPRGGRKPGKAEKPIEADVAETTPVDVEASVPKPNAAKSRVPVVGIGASAGGLDAFKKFLAAMPADSPSRGIAFVLIPHLDPTHESLMVELLSKYTTMPVVEAKEGTAVKADNVYIIPPNKQLAIQGGVLRLSSLPPQRSGQTSIDFF